MDLNQKLDASSDERFEDTVRTHHYLKMFACNKADISTQVTFDDGFLSLGGGLSHFGVFPNVESPYKDLPDNEIKNFPPNTKPTPFIPAP